MATKKMIFGEPARKALKEGSDYLIRAVGPTIGPYGQNFNLEKGDGVTNDGKKIAMEAVHPDEFSHKGLHGIRKAGIKTEEEVKDASTTAMILADAIFESASKLMPRGAAAKGKMPPAVIIRKVEEEVADVTAKLKAMAVPVTTREELVASALVSTENKQLADLIGGTQFELGPDGVIIVEETIDQECTIEKVPGIQIDNGLGATNVINDVENQRLVVKDAKIILTNHVVMSLAPILKTILVPLSNSGVTNLIIVARAWNEKAIKDCMDNMKAGFNIYPMNAPYTDMREVMKDLSAVSGAKYIDKEETEFSDMTLEDVGDIEKLQAERYTAIFTPPGGLMAQERIDKRVKELDEKLSGKLSAFERGWTERRKAQLTNGFGILKIGSTSETDRKRLKDKADDAVGATRWAFKEGVVPGAGKAFKAIAEGLPADSILKRPLSVIYDQIMASAPEGFVIEDWVRDPVKVMYTALKHAAIEGVNLATVTGVDATIKDKPRLVQEVQQPDHSEEESN